MFLRLGEVLLLTRNGELDDKENMRTRKIRTDENSKLNMYHDEYACYNIIDSCISIQPLDVQNFRVNEHSLQFPFLIETLQVIIPTYVFMIDKNVRYASLLCLLFEIILDILPFLYAVSI
jgi:hypothetical protein